MFISLGYWELLLIVCSLLKLIFGLLCYRLPVDWEYWGKCLVSSMMRKMLGVFRCFWIYLLPVLEYSSSVWLSAADCHLRLLDRVVSWASAMCGGAIHCDLWHSRLVTSLCLFYNLRDNDHHPDGSLFPAARRVPIRVTRRGLVAHAFTLEVPRVRTSQFSR